MVKFSKTQKRRLARILALQMCYLFDVKGIDEPEKAAELFEIFLLQKPESDEYMFKRTKGFTVEELKSAEELFGIFLRQNPDSDEYVSEYAEECLTVNSRFEIDENNLAYARELVRGIMESRAEIDGLIRMNMTGWRPERMGIIDRAAVYLALYEGVIGRKADVPLAISEAVELAKLFGSDESARFVNGVLGKIVRAVLPSVGADETSAEKDAKNEEFKNEELKSEKLKKEE